jgi:hypothetical protein
MKYVLGAGAVIAALGTAAYLYLQHVDGVAAEQAKANAAGAEPDATPESNI